MSKCMSGFAVVFAVICPMIVHAAQHDNTATYTDPKEAGPDYVVQGEYVGKIDTGEGDGSWGVQIVALGDARFSLVGYEGGLPGDGWKRGDRTETAEGKRTGDVTRFEGDGWEGELKGKLLTISGPDGAEAGTLKKVDRTSPTMGAKPPRGAVVLFDGSSADQFENGKIVMGGLLLADCTSKQKFGDQTLHLEFRTPFKPEARGQQRGNSGVYMQSRYEIQVLDSFGLDGKDNECGGIYKIVAPRVNMCFPPLTWQTYDVDFTAARYEDNKKVKNARITVKHNGVVIIDDVELPHETPGRMKEGPDPASLFLQGHGNPVVYRNIWVVEKKQKKSGRRPRAMTLESTTPAG